MKRAPPAKSPSDGPAIVIRFDAGRFAVGIEPGEDPASPFDDHRSAYGFASGLRMTTGFRIVDETAGLATDG